MLHLRQQRPPPVGVPQRSGRGVQAAGPDAGRCQRAVPARHRPRPRERRTQTLVANQGHLMRKQLEPDRRQCIAPS